MLNWFLDPSIVHPNPTEAANLEPLLINTAGSWSDRPEAATDIHNLVLASDYVRTHTDLATMEGANEAARRAVNAIIERSGFRASKCQLWPLREPALFAPARAIDKLLYKLGRPPRQQLRIADGQVGAPRLLSLLAPSPSESAAPEGAVSESRLDVAAFAWGQRPCALWPLGAQLPLGRRR